MEVDLAHSVSNGRGFDGAVYIVKFFVLFFKYK